MTSVPLYLAISRRTSTMRGHFGLFVPRPEYDRPTLSQDFKSQPTLGMIIHVVGEPLLAGFTFEIKRNTDCMILETDLKKLVHLGDIDGRYTYHPPGVELFRESFARSEIEGVAEGVPVPPRGQNLRVPVDGVSTKRCQEWTMEVLHALVAAGFVDEAAIEIAQGERDPPTFGIVGGGKAQ